MQRKSELCKFKGSWLRVLFLDIVPSYLILSDNIVRKMLIRYTHNSIQFINGTYMSKVVKLCLFYWVL